MVLSITAGDYRILLWIQENLRFSFLNAPMRFITTLGDVGFIWILLCLILLVFSKTRKVGFVALISLGICIFINNAVLKVLIERERPFQSYSNIIALIPIPHDSSFPSGHTCSSFAVAGILAKYLDRKYGIAAYTLAGLIAFSRLYVGVHYPTDVLAGMLLGIVGSHIIYYYFENYRKIRK